MGQAIAGHLPKNLGALGAFAPEERPPIIAFEKVRPLIVIADNHPIPICGRKGLPKADLLDAHGSV